MAKVKELAERIEVQVRGGEYGFRAFPSERKLARELGVARMTARGAIGYLLKKNILLRQPNGRIVVRRKMHGHSVHLVVAALVPSFTSADVQAWLQALDTAAEKMGISTRAIFYKPSDDVLLRDAIAGFDGIFLMPYPVATQSPKLKLFHNSPNPVVVFDTDCSREGFVSVKLFSAPVYRPLFEHLAELGHRHVDCLNWMPHGPVIKERIGAWKSWINERKLEGRLIDFSCDAGQKPAVQIIREELQSGRIRATALVCTTTPLAIVASRACYELGIIVGRDISICAMNGEGLSAMQCPSITALERPDAVPYLEACLEWIKSGRRWTGPRLICPKNAPLFIGESTGPAPGSPGSEMAHENNSTVVNEK